MSSEELTTFQGARIAAARLLAQGFTSKSVAKVLGKKLVPLSPHEDPAKVAHAAYHKLRRMMRNDKEFRDLIYTSAVVELDLKTPAILGGVADAAIRGRVDAAKLALAITDRYKDETPQVTAVQVVLQNVPRPE
jgi:hypothetical protein